MQFWLKVFGCLIIFVGFICFIIGLQESVAIKKGFIEYSLSESLGEDIKEHLLPEQLKKLKQAKKSMFYSGIKHALYGILFMLSGIGIILKKAWGKVIFLALWLIIFMSNIYYVIKEQSYFYILVLSLCIVLVSLLIFRQPAAKKYFK